MSPLRLIGLVVAAAVLVVEVRSLWHRRPRGIDAAALGVAGVLALVALVPALANVPAEVLHLRRTPAGRLITLLVLFDVLVVPYVLWLNERLRRAAEDANMQFEALVTLAMRGMLPEQVAPVAVVMPAYNEGESIGRVLERMPDQVLGQPIQVVVAADGCTDATVAEARQAGALVVDLPLNRGAGTAIRVAYNYAARAGAKVIVTMDADGQHRPEDLEQIVAPVLGGEADFVIGSRRLGRFERVSTLRSAGLDLFNRMLNLLFGTRITDCSSGFRAFAAGRLPRLDTIERQYHTTETIMLAHRRGLRIQEVAITAPRRIAGTSKKGTDILYGVRFGRVLITHWLRG
ncbi:MAG TPA: glycosyltransferase family 2 protein [Bacillota bacterium]|nr:glycosyltransferase family 2 protein [Bacillota bacterium]